MAGMCQDCDGCCRVLEVKELNKPLGVPCQHLGATLFGSGCTIYAERPEPCKQYVCLWLDSQRRPGTERFAADLRPDVSKVVLGWPWGIERDVMYVFPYPDYQDNWRLGPVGEYLRAILALGAKVVVMLKDKRIVLKGDMAVVGTQEEFDEVPH